MCRLVLVLVALAFAGGCGKEKGDDHVKCEAPGGCSAVHSTLDTGESRVELVADGSGGVYAGLFGSRFEPACAGTVICHGELWRIDEFGDVRWKHKESDSVYGVFRVPGGVAYETGSGKLVVLDDDGDKRFSVSTGDPELAASAVSGSLYVIAAGEISRIDLESGETMWSEPAPEDRPVPAVPTGDGFVLTLGFTTGTDGALTARTFEEPDGKAGWTAELPAQLSAPGLIAGYSDLEPTLLVSDRLSLRAWGGAEVWGHDGPEGFRFVSRTRTNGFFAGGPYFDQVTEYRVDGTVLWSRPMPAALTWVAGTPDGHVLVGQADGVVRKLKSGAGTTLWDYGAVDSVQPQASPLFGANGNAVLWGANIGIDSDTHVTTLTPFGQGLDRWDAGARVVSGALSDDDDVFTATLDGLIYLRESAEF